MKRLLVILLVLIANPVWAGPIDGYFCTRWGMSPKAVVESACLAKYKLEWIDRNSVRYITTNQSGKRVVIFSFTPDTRELFGVTEITHYTNRQTCEGLNHLAYSLSLYPFHSPTYYDYDACSYFWQDTSGEMILMMVAAEGHTIVWMLSIPGVVSRMR